jgi:hypothetical protein
LVAAGSAAFAVGFFSYIWLAHDAVPAIATPRAEPRAFAAADTSAAIAEAPIRNNARSPLAHLEAGDDFAIRWQDAPSAPISVTTSFGERFAFDGSETSLQASRAPSSHVSVFFDDRFIGEGLASSGLIRPAPAPTTVARAAAPPAAKRPVVAQAAPKRAPKAGFQLASASETSLALGYAPTDSATSSGMTGSLQGSLPKELDPLADVDTSRTAIYDISSHTVYLPNGRRLEAHSGLGDRMDDPRSVAVRNVGVTPPNVYDLKLRESLFHGVRAIRLIPKDNSKMYGRAGILAHSYMLGPNGQSNGCVSFSDYSAFLDAYQRGEVTTLVVVERLAGAPPSPKTAADWLSNTLKAIFQRS